MRIDYSARANKALQDASATVRKAVFKQVSTLAHNLRHPSLHAKKYDESRDLWQARVTKGWRLYFLIQSGHYSPSQIA